MKRKETAQYDQQPESLSTDSADGKLLREQMLARAIPPHPLSKMSYQEFLAWADEDRPAEWVDGEVILMSPASRKHQELIRFLTSLLGIYVETLELGALLPSPFQMKLEHGREPDLLFVAHADFDRLKPTYLDGPANLAVEIISPESIERDRIDKYHEYERGGVQEFWLIDPDRHRADFYVLDESGRYKPIQIDGNGVVHSTVLPGFWLQVDWLWMEPLPKTLEILKMLNVL